jgi:isocitrate/isopropylmalate dehydrogenase
MLMFSDLGEAKMAAAIEQAIVAVLTEGKVRTYDLGGTSSTSDVGEDIAEKLRRGTPL